MVDMTYHTERNFLITMLNLVLLLTICKSITTKKMYHIER